MPTYFRSFRTLIWSTLMVVLLVIVAHRAGAQESPYWKKNGSRTPLSFSLTFGSRFEAHYNRIDLITTPPDTLLAEAQLGIWYKNQLGLYLTFATSAAKVSATVIGGGTRLPLLTLASESSPGITGISILLVGELAHYSTQEPTPPKIYEPSQITIRFGGSIYWKLGRTNWYIDSTMMVHELSSNLFIAPFVGLGFHF